MSPAGSGPGARPPTVRLSAALSNSSPTQCTESVKDSLTQLTGVYYYIRLYTLYLLLRDWNRIATCCFTSVAILSSSTDPTS